LRNVETVLKEGERIVGIKSATKEDTTRHFFFQFVIGSRLDLTAVKVLRHRLSEHLTWAVYGYL
jgi:hypothetical protein